MLSVKRLSILMLTMLTVCLFSCDRRLSSEKQQQLQEAAKSQQIQRVTENQMIAFVQSRGDQLDSAVFNTENQADLLEKLRKIAGEEYPVSYVLPEQATTGELSQVMEAYLFSVASEQGSGSNLQTLNDGNIMYTIPHITDSAGIKVLRGVWKIEFTRKEMINEIFRMAEE